MITLAIDTSSKACSCAIIREGLLLGESYLNCGLTHSVTLMCLIERTVRECDITFESIDKIAVANGPGSYTGVRIGVAAAKGLAMAKKIPCVGVSTLLSLAHNLLPFEGAVCCALDARVGQVFAAIFNVKNGVVERVSPDNAIALSELEKILPDGAMVCGDGAALVCESFPDKRLRLAPPALRYQRASSAGYAAKNTEGESAELLSAQYHRKSQAEREREAKEKQA